MLHDSTNKLLWLRHAGTACILWCACSSYVIAHAECERATTTAELAVTVHAAEAAWRSLDSDALQAASDDATAQVECLNEPIGSVDVASYFRTRSLADFVAGAVDASRHAITAARAVQPRYRIPDSMLSASHPIRSMYEEAPYLHADPPTVLDLPTVGWIQIDGKRATHTPAGRPYVFQHFQDDGAVLQTLIVPPGEQPSFAVKVPDPTLVASTPAPGPTIPEPRTSRHFLIAAVATGAISITSIGVAGSLKSRYVASPPKDGDLQGVITANRVLGYGGIGLGVVSVGLGTGAVLSGTW